MPSVFISYSRADSVKAALLCKALASSGVEVVIDKFDANPGEVLMDTLYKLVQENDLALVLLSPTSVKSDYVKAEAIFGLGAEQRTGRLRVVPLVIEKKETDGWFEKLVPAWLRERIVDDISGWLDAGASEDDTAFRRILETIKKHTLSPPSRAWAPLAIVAAAVMGLSFVWPILDLSAGAQRLRLVVRSVAFGLLLASGMRLSIWWKRQHLQLSQRARPIAGAAGVVGLVLGLVFWPVHAITPPKIEQVVVGGNVSVRWAPITLDAGHQLRLCAWQEVPHAKIIHESEPVPAATRQTAFDVDAGARGFVRLLIQDVRGKVLVQSAATPWSRP